MISSLGLVGNIKPLLQTPQTLEEGAHVLRHARHRDMRRSIYEASFVKGGPLGESGTTRLPAEAVCYV
jgi:hypothetical protein